METLHKSVREQFRLDAPVVSCERYGCGHINETYVFSCQTADAQNTRYILQKINTAVFRDPIGLMENICRVTSFLRTKIAARGGDPNRETLTVLPTRAGAAFFRAAEIHKRRIRARQIRRRTAL